MTTNALITGAGVDELVAAHLLARAGYAVTVLDPRDDTRAPRETVGWIPPAITRELGLEPLKIARDEPWVAAPLDDGARLELSHDMARSIESIRRVSERDAARWPDFCTRVASVARLLEAIYTAPPPDPLANDRRELLRMARTALRARRSGKQAIVDLFRVVPMPVADLLDDWFESDALKGLIGAAAIRHQRQGPRSSGTAYGLLHHHVGNAIGVFHPPRSNLHEMLSKRPGLDIRSGARVDRIEVRDGRVAGVTLASGEHIETGLVISGEHPRRVLLQWIDAKWIDPALVRATRNIRSRGVMARVTLVLDSAPDFSTLVIAPSLDYLQRAHDAAKVGRISDAPWLEARDAGRAADGTHRVDVHVQCAPYALTEGQWTDAQCEALGQRTVEILGRRLPSLRSSVQSIRVESPHYLEAAYGWNEGQAYSAELALDQWLWMRPTPQLARYRTPIGGLYLCGRAMHPGGSIAGATGANAVREVLGALQRAR